MAEASRLQDALDSLARRLAVLGVGQTGSINSAVHSVVSRAKAEERSEIIEQITALPESMSRRDLVLQIRLRGTDE